MTWQQSKRISEAFGTAVLPPWNLWWSDLPISITRPLIQALSGSEIEESGLRISGASRDWSPDSLQDLDSTHEPTLTCGLRGCLSGNHGIVKSCLLTLGLQHHHEAGDIVISSNWEGLLEGLGLMNEEGVVVNSKDAIGHIDDRLVRLEKPRR